MPARTTPPSVHWRKSTYSGDDGSNCVEVADLATRVGVRDSKDVGGVPLAVSKTAWASFVGQVARRA